MLQHSAVHHSALFQPSALSAFLFLAPLPVICTHPPFTSLHFSAVPRPLLAPFNSLLVVLQQWPGPASGPKAPLTRAGCSVRPLSSQHPTVGTKKEGRSGGRKPRAVFVGLFLVQVSWTKNKNVQTLQGRKAGGCSSRSPGQKQEHAWSYQMS